ncbi:MAG: O-antigen ligase family protein [Desulfosarcina sp.]|nr:O-antigen ligase family protein [Desulfosarcina sp.]MBC2764916.1 O-antigen ligase family protein [Desulfosarcina sp.]
MPFKDSIYEIFNGFLGIIFLYLVFKNRDLDFILKNKKANTICSLLFLSMTVSNFLGNPGPYGWEKQVQFFYRYILLYYAVLYFLERNYISINFIFNSTIISLGIQAIALLDLLRNVHFKKEKALTSLIILMLFFMFMFCLINSGSRSSLLGFFVAISLFTILHYRNLLKPKKICLVIFILVLSAFLVWFNGDLMINRILFVLNGDSSVRFELWRSSVKFIIDSPIFGHGIQENNVFLTIDAIDITSPHNAYLEICVYLGITGLAIYAFLFFSVLKKSAVILKKRPFYLLVITGIFVSAIFDHTFITSQILISVLCLILSCLCYELKNHMIFYKYFTTAQVRPPAGEATNM